MRPSKRKALPATPLGDLRERLEHTKASIRAKVEHPFHVVNDLFRYRKTRYKGLAKPIWSSLFATDTAPESSIRTAAKTKVM